MGELVPIGSFLPSEVATDEVEAILREAGVVSWIEGSRAYQVSVHRANADSAVAALKASAVGSRILFYRYGE
jgi:hypothetical protein